MQVTGAVDGSDGSREFMVREEALARLGARVGLSFVRSYSHPALRGVLPRGAGADAALKARPRPARSLRRAAPPARGATRGASAPAARAATVFLAAVEVGW